MLQSGRLEVRRCSTCSCRDHQGQSCRWAQLVERPFRWVTRGIVFQESVAIALNRRFICYYYFLVLGIPHPAVNTRDVALYQPFRNALKTPNQLVRLPTLTFHLMGRRCQEGQQNPVRVYHLTPGATDLFLVA